MFRPSHRLCLTLAIVSSSGPLACGGAPVSNPSSAPAPAKSTGASLPTPAPSACDKAKPLRAAIAELLGKGKLLRARRVMAQVMEACSDADAETRAKDLATSAELALELMDDGTARANASKLLAMQDASEPMKQRAQTILTAADELAKKLVSPSQITILTRKLIGQGNALSNIGDPPSLRGARVAFQSAWDAQPTSQTALGMAIVAKKLGDQVLARQFLDRAFAMLDRDKKAPKAALPSYEQLVTRIRWSGGRRFLVIAQGEELRSGDNEIAVIDTVTGVEHLHWFRGGLPDDDVALSHDGDLLGIKSFGDASILDIGARMVIRSHSKLPVSNVTSFSSDLMKLAVADDRTPYVLNLVDGTKTPVFENWPEDAANPTSIVFSPNGETLAMPLDDGKIPLWNIPAKRISDALSGHGGMLMYSAFAHDGTHFLTSALDKSELRLWDTRRGTLKRVFKLKKDEIALSIAVSPDASAVAAMDATGLTVWNANTGAVRQKFGESTLPTAMAFSPDSSLLAIQCVQSTVCIADLESGKIEEVANVRDPAIRSIAISPDGKTMLAVPEDDTLRIIDLQKGTLQSTQSVPETTRDVAISPNGALYGITGTKFRVWNPQTQAVLREDSFPFQSQSLAFSPDSTQVAVAAKEVVRIYSLTTKDPPREFVGHTDRISRVAISPDGRLLATGSFDKTVRIWDLASGTVKHVISTHTIMITGLAFSPDGKFLASAARRDPIQVWDVETGQSRYKWTPWKPSILDGAQDIAFSPKGLSLGIANSNKKLLIWDVVNDKMQAMHPGQTDASSATFTPDGQWFVSGWDNGTVLLQPPEGRGPTVSIRFLAGKDSGYVVDSLGHADLLGSLPCAARSRIWCRTEHLGLPFDLCEDQVLTRGLIGKTLARESLERDPLQTDDPPTCPP